MEVTKANLDECFGEILHLINQEGVAIVETKSAKTGKWGMARLWRKWMSETAEFMANNGSTMPLMISKDGKHYGQRPFNEKDAHELFTSQWLGLDEEGSRLSWARKTHDGMRAANKGERWLALFKHEQWCLEKGIKLTIPRDSEYKRIEEEQSK